MKLSIIPCLIFLSSCSIVEKQSVVYMSNWREEHQQEVMDNCYKEAVHLTLLNYEANGYSWTEQDVAHVERILKESCWKFNNIVI